MSKISTALTDAQWAKRIEKIGACVVAYRSLRGGWEVPATAHQAFDSLGEAIATGHITPGNGRRLVVRGPDFNVVEDHGDPLPSLASRLALVGEPALPQLIYPRPVRDVALDPAPMPPGYIGMDVQR